VKLENVQKDVVMSTSPVSASNQLNLAAFFAPATVSSRHAERGDRDSSGDGNSQGITLLASLLQALVQAATPPAAAATASAGGTATAAAATGTSSATSTTGSAATGTTSAASGTATGTTGATSTTNLVGDLQAFLHDLFSALRQAGRSGHGGREHELWQERAATATSATTAPSTSAPASSTTAPASSTTTAAPATTGGTVTATTSSPAAAGSTTPVTVPTNPAVSGYGPRNIISELKALVQELSNGQASSSTGSSGGVSQRLSNLNSAFEKLISDLNGTASAAGTPSTAGAAAAGASTSGTSTAGTAAAGASTTAPSSTSALQAFLTNFAQDLQNNGAHSLSPVGSSVNTTA
jgi:hypothetical protein